MLPDNQVGMGEFGKLRLIVKIAECDWTQWTISIRRFEYESVFRVIKGSQYLDTVPGVELHDLVACDFRFELRGELSCSKHNIAPVPATVNGRGKLDYALRLEPRTCGVNSLRQRCRPFAGWWWDQTEDLQILIRDKPEML